MVRNAQTHLIDVLAWLECAGNVFKIALLSMSGSRTLALDRFVLACENTFSIAFCCINLYITWRTLSQKIGVVPHLRVCQRTAFNRFLEHFHAPFLYNAMLTH